MTTHTVTVWDKQYEVKVDRLSKAVWRASGDYEGEPLQTQDRTERSALGRWREAARYRGNDGAPAPTKDI